MSRRRLAIVTTHPIQYNAPLFRFLAGRGTIDVKVFYTWGNVSSTMFDKRFGLKREWDIPLTEGYEFEMLHNYAAHPDSNRFFGIINWRLHNKIQQWKPDTVLVYRWSVWSHFVFMSFFRLKNCRLLFRGDSVLYPTSGSFQEKVLTWVKQFVFRKVNSALYVGMRNRRYYEHLGFQDARLIYAPHCIDNQHFQKHAAEWEQKAALRRTELGINANDIVFLYSGKFYEVKDLTTLVRAFKQTEGAFYKLILAGSGKQEQELRALASTDQRILFLGFSNQSEMPVIYRLANVFVLPSIKETWGLSVNEAMACGRPVLVSDACGCSDDLVDVGSTGYLFKSGNEHDLTLKLQLFNDLQLINQMGRSAMKKINEFSFDRLARIIEEAV